MKKVLFSIQIRSNYIYNIMYNKLLYKSLLKIENATIELKNKW